MLGGCELGGDFGDFGDGFELKAEEKFEELKEKWVEISSHEIEEVFDAEGRVLEKFV